MIVVSVASGTSADGLDVAVVDLDWTAPGVIELASVQTSEVSWPDGLGERILGLLPPAATTAREVCLLDADLGQAMAAAVAPFARDATLIVSPGQTVHHEVHDDRCLATLQIGRPAWVAAATGVPVLSDLRSSDVAVGGNGAPLASTLDSLWLGADPVRRAALNLGGIANVSLVGAGLGTLALDTGPANCLLDLVAARATGGTFDADGALAASGRVDPDVLARMLADPYFAMPAPKSTGRELFSAAWLAAMAPGSLDDADLAATLVDLTAVTVADALAGSGIEEVVVSGGGARNPELMRRLAEVLAPVPVVTSDAHGLDPDGKEAVLWALLGFLSWHGVPGTVPGTDGRTVTGASRPVVLGSFTPGVRPLVLPTPRTDPVERLVVRR